MLGCGQKTGQPLGSVQVAAMLAWYRLPSTLDCTVVYRCDLSVCACSILTCLWYADHTMWMHAAHLPAMRGWPRCPDKPHPPFYNITASHMIHMTSCHAMCALCVQAVARAGGTGGAGSSCDRLPGAVPAHTRGGAVLAGAAAAVATAAAVAVAVAAAGCNSSGSRRRCQQQLAQHPVCCSMPSLQLSVAALQL